MIKNAKIGIVVLCLRWLMPLTIVGCRMQASNEANRAAEKPRITASLAYSSLSLSVYIIADSKTGQEYMVIQGTGLVVMPTSKE